jgi:UDP-glucose 4-epimerase
MMNVLVTGANGFIGKSLCMSLSMRGDNVIKLVRNKIVKDESLQYEYDFETKEFPEEALEGIDVIYHLAGIAHDITGSVFIDNQYYLVNVDATVKIATLAAKKNIKHFIFVSSAKAGGDPSGGVCSNEENLNIPKDIYAVTKREAEKKIIAIGKEFDLNVTIMRPSLVYGPNAGGNLKSMLLGIKKGWFPPIPKIDNRRSMVHIDDLVGSMIFVTNNKDAFGEIFIVTDGIPHSTRELYEEMCKLLGKDIPKWTMPIFLFNLLSKISKKLEKKVSKLLGDECYSSDKLESIGFKPQRKLSEINETYI